MSLGVLVVATTFSILSITFAISGVLLVMKIKKYFPDFFVENKCTLIGATVGLSTSLMFRGVLDNLKYWDPAVFYKSFDIINMSNILLFIFGDVIPLIFQLSTMVFGYIRKKNDNRTKLVVG